MNPFIKVKYVSNCLDGKRIPLSSEERGKIQGEIPYWGANGVVDYVDDYLFDEELVLLGEDGAPFFDKRKQVSFCVNQKVWINNHIHVLRTKNYHSKFLMYSLNSVDYRPFIDGTTRDKLTQDKMKVLLVPYPPLETQKQIADFLDKETTRIDTLISKKQKQIELLQEKRQAIIIQSVTNGLNPYVKMKNSGVEWIGEIPEHWDVLRMRFLMEINPPKSKCKILDHSKEISFVPMELVGDRGEIDTTNRKSIEEVYNGYTFFEDGDVVFAKITPCFENGKGAVARNLVNKTGFGTTELHVLRPYQDILNNDYLYLIIHSYIFRKIGESTMYGAGGQKRVPENYIKNFPLPLPPIHEQRDILKNANDEVSRIDDLENKINRSIHLLKEYRSSLITHAVSGQIDISKYEVSK